MKHLPANAAVALFAVFFSGCVVPFPFQTARTPDISGRVVDSSTRLPVAHATVQFLSVGDTPLPSPKMITDETGQFHLPRTRNWHLGAIIVPHGWVCIWPDGPDSKILQIEHAGYAGRTLNLNHAFKASGLSNRNKFMGEDILCYDGLFPLGDILLDR